MKLPLPERPTANEALVAEVRKLEERLFPDQIDPDLDWKMKSKVLNYTYFRPSHHFHCGLVNTEDLDVLQNGGKLLSIGSGPAYLEKTIAELGVPPENILLADTNHDDLDVTGFNTVTMDVHTDWPDIGQFDRIIFPESLAVSTAGYIDDEIKSSLDPILLPDFPDWAAIINPRDEEAVEVLTKCFAKVLRSLKPNGLMRANGPVYELHVAGLISSRLTELGFPHQITLCNDFLEIRRAKTNVPNELVHAFGDAYREWLLANSD